MKRIQRKRTKGWRMPRNTIYVGRPTKWGNPFHVKELGAVEAVKRYKECILNNAMVYYYFDEIEASIQFDRFKWMSKNLEQLRGKDLACFCSLSSPCHADILIELLTAQSIRLAPVFTCKACKCKLPIDFQMRTEGFCYLCDPNITIEELLSSKPLVNITYK